jgi:hypothetical protein
MGENILEWHMNKREGMIGRNSPIIIIFDGQEGGGNGGRMGGIKFEGIIYIQERKGSWPFWHFCISGRGRGRELNC